MNQRSMVVSIIGRPNVGKSTIFNRLMKKQHLAMTHDQPGVTRDRHYGILKLEEVVEGTELKEDIILVDTGGFYPDKIEIDTHKKKNNVDPFFNIMADHAKLAINESDLVLFIVDVREGLLPFDKGICDYIKSTKKPFWLVMNKFDTEKQEGDQYDFYTLGLDEDDMLRVSAEHNRGFYDLREKLLINATKFKESELAKSVDGHLQNGVKPRNDVVASVAIIGAPNAGKSTLLNCLVGAQRALVSEIAGTTVDPIEGYIDLYFGPDVEMLTTRDNQFRKDNEEMFEELKRFQESGDVDLNISVDEEDLTEEEKKIYVEFGQTTESTFDEGEEDDVGAGSDFSFDESNTGPDYFSEKEILGEIEKNWDNTSEEEVADLEFAQYINRWRSIKLVDTAGIRKSKLVEGFIETQSVYRSLRSITESDIVLFMIDSTLGITHQDRRLCDIALEKGKSVIICLNKIDLLKETFADQKKKKEWLENLRDEVPWLSFCQLVTISAQKNRNINYLREAVKRTIVVRNRKIPTGALNRCLLQLTDRNPVVVKKTSGTKFKVKYASMLKTSPPTFLLFSNKSQGIPENYRRYLINGLRKEFDLTNTPVHLIFRTSTDIERRMRKVEKKKSK
ncbi:MAG: 50S ribosome-binding GTPase [Bacteriovoracaceae bacterium]|nr:50S ribosome-binding GTPase [Bacteriovoracaceae bacterium]